MLRRTTRIVGAFTLALIALMLVLVLLEAPAVSSHDISLQRPSVDPATLTKTVGLNPAACGPQTAITVPAGTEVTYCYQMKNTTPDSFLEYHGLYDDQLGALLDDYPHSLSVGESFSYTFSTRVWTDTTNYAEWTGYDGNFNTLSTAAATATVRVVAPNPAILLTKTVGLDPNRCSLSNEIVVPERGALVTYCYRVTNIGNIPFDELFLEDNQFSILSDTYSAGLLPGETYWVTQTQSVTASTLNQARVYAYNYNREIVETGRDWAGVIAGSRPTKEWIAEPTETITGTYTPTNGVGFTTTLVVPAGAVSNTEQITFGARLVPGYRLPDNVEYANYSFDIEVLPDTFRLYLPLIRKSGEAVGSLYKLLAPASDGYLFKSPVTLIIEYDEGWLPPEIDEATLHLIYWTGDGWADAATTCPGGSVYDRDLLNNRLQISLCHFSRYGFVGD